MTFANRVDLPPIHDPFVDMDGKLHPTAAKWVNDVQAVMGEHFVEGVARTGGPTVPPGSDINFIQLPVMTTAQRDSVTNVPDGVIIYNSTIPAVQARVGGAWVSL